MPPDNVIPLPEPENDLQQQAMSWVVRLNSGEASKGDRQAFTLWIQQSDAHRQAFFEARRLWLSIGQLELTDTEALPSSPDNSHPVRSAKPRTRLFHYGFAVSMLFVGLLLMHPLYLRYIAADFRTEVGEIKTLQLFDGSTVYLNTDSLLAEHFSEQTRHIELLAGEAEFDGAPDKIVLSSFRWVTARPAPWARVSSSYTQVDKVKVSVLDHAVEISSANHEPVTLNTGFKLEYGDKGLLDVPKAIVPAETNAWRNGKLKFNAMPLKEVVAEIDRYLPGKIVLANAGYADHQVSGMFEIKNLDGAIDVIVKSLHLQTASIGPLLYVIY